MPDTGRTPTTAPRLIAAWPTIQAVTPAASSMPNRSGARRATRKPTRPNAGEQREHEDAADEPELLADDREDEVGVRVGQEHPLGATRAEPDAVDAAAAERDQRLGDLVAGVRLVVPRVQEREHAGAAVGRREREHGRRRRPRSRRASRDACAAHRPRSAARTRSARARSSESRSGSSITSTPEPAEQDQHGRPLAASRRDVPSGGRARRRRRTAARAWRSPTAGRGTADAEPAARAVDRDTDAGHEHDDQADQRDDEHEGRPVAASGGSRCVDAATNASSAERAPTSTDGRRSTTTTRSR